MEIRSSKVQVTTNMLSGKCLHRRETAWATSELVALPSETERFRQTIPSASYGLQTGPVVTHPASYMGKGNGKIFPLVKNAFVNDDERGGGCFLNLGTNCRGSGRLHAPVALPCVNAIRMRT
jgi:hypothetical protein